MRSKIAQVDTIVIESIRKGNYFDDYLTLADAKVSVTINGNRYSNVSKAAVTRIQNWIVENCYNNNSTNYYLVRTEYRGMDCIKLVTAIRHRITTKCFYKLNSPF